MKNSEFRERVLVNEQFAREIGIDLSTISGSGPGGRIVVEDVEAASVKEKPNAKSGFEEG